MDTHSHEYHEDEKALGTQIEHGIICGSRRGATVFIHQSEQLSP
ncbi:hypothetical protein ACFXOM_08925 [Streptomyces sp. NPDC059169]